ncbi:MAG: hypothetical protein OEV99_10795 [Nitrospira sp.]|nr:hypothetical protein [Nitrospira sp.]MDH4370321.1 hypothetical protein [Nitrospira sp.]MDH5499189.1 hypothetical protein [Nitrospira sp.]MDH5725375.1 hypothetical protein [Nitrospira sp.]
MRQAVLWSLAVSCLLILPTPAAAERNWEFSIGGYGGWAFHGDTTARFTWATTPFGFEPVDARGNGLRFENSGTYGIKISGWHLPRKYKWQPQIGFELDGTRFTADVPPQTIPGEGVGKTSQLPLGPVTLPDRLEFGVDNLAVNLLFRYPIWGTPDLPHGRWYPYVGIGGGVQRARLSTGGYEETSYSPVFQGLVGVKLFLIKHVAIFGEAKYTQGWHSFDYAEIGAPSDYKERYTIVTGNVVGGVALHF